MGSYGRAVGFRQSPLPEHRLGRWKTGATAIAQFAPVIADGALDENGRRSYVIAPEGTVRPDVGTGGICVFEVPDGNYRGYDPVLTRPSDIWDAPANTAAQLVHGTEVRIEMLNVAEDDFRGMRDPAYPARTMVAGASGATPTVEIDERLIPGVGTDALGYWKVGGSATTAWLIVTEVDPEIGLVVAQMLF